MSKNKRYVQIYNQTINNKKKIKTTTSGYKFQSKIMVKFKYNNFGVTSKAYTSGYKLKIVR